MDNKSKKIIYEILMMFLAVVIVVTTVIQLTITLPKNINVLLEGIDTIIYYIFVLDYFIRLVLSKNKWEFIKNNKIDLITIIPFTTLFVSFRVVRFLKVTDILKTTKTLKASVFISNIAKKGKKLLKTNNFIYFVIITATFIISCATLISIFENISFKDALWWSFVTTTTVGYGDIAPTSDFGRVVAVVLMLTGVTFMGLLTGTISTYFLRKDNTIERCDLKKETINSIKNKLDNIEEISDEDVEDIISMIRIIRNESKK